MRSKITLFVLCFFIIATPTGFAEKSNSNNDLVNEARRLKDMGKKVEDRIEKPLPLGNNVELSFDFDWSSNFLLDTKLKILGTKREYVLEYAELREDVEGENYDYRTKGYGTKFQINNLINQQIKVNFGLIYAKNNYIESNESNHYTIVRFENSAQVNSRNKLKLVADYAIAGADTEENFQKMRFDWNWRKELSEDEKFIYDFQIGVASSATPAAYKFKIGGFNGLKLRGLDDEIAGDVCVVNSFKYQKKLLGEHKFKFLVLEELSGSVFTDVGKVTTSDNFWHRGLQMGFGVGLSTKLNLVEIQAKLAVDEVSSSPQFHLKFKEDF